MKLVTVIDTSAKRAFTGTALDAKFYIDATYSSARGDLNRGWHVKGGFVSVVHTGTYTGPKGAGSKSSWTEVSFEESVSLSTGAFFKGKVAL